MEDFFLFFIENLSHSSVFPTFNLFPENFLLKLKEANPKIIFNNPEKDRLNLSFSYLIRHLLVLSEKIKSDPENGLSQVRKCLSDILTKKGQLDDFLTKEILEKSENNDKSENILKDVDKTIKVCLVFGVFWVLIQLYIKENHSGKSFLFEDSGKKLSRQRKEKLGIKPKIMVEYDFKEVKQWLYESLENEKEEALQEKEKENLVLNEYNLRKIKNIAFMNTSKQLTEYLSVDGEIWNDNIKYPQIFLLCKIIIDQLIENQGSDIYNSEALFLWKARLNYFHNLGLDRTPVAPLKKLSCNNYQNFFNGNFCKKLSNQTQANIRVEFCQVLMFYYKYELAEKQLIQAEDLLKFKFRITGVWGKRTKYQQFKTAQLVIYKDALENEISDIPNPQSLIVPSDMLPTYVTLPEDTILHEKPVLDEEAPTEVDSAEEQILLLGYIELLRKSTPDTEIRREQISAYLDRFLVKSLDFLVFSKGLYLRSINEFPSYKRRERSLLQLEELIIQFNQLEKNKQLKNDEINQKEEMSEKKEEEVIEKKMKINWSEETWRRLNFFYVWYPDFITLQKTLAEKYMEMGCVLSSCQLFERIGELEQCVECLAMAGHVTEARERAGKLIGEGRKTPKLLCILGDINNGDKLLYKEAWKLSNKKFSRAQRSLGRVYLNGKAFQKSAKAFEKALAINSYQASAWFTLGCVYLAMSQFEKALKSFSAVIQIDETQGEAWANLSNTFVSLGKPLQGLSALEQGLKFNENSWRMWENMLRLSLDVKKFHKFIEAIEKLVLLDQKNIIDMHVLSKLPLILRYHVLNPEFKNATIVFYYKRLLEIYKLLTERIGEKWEVWETYADLTEFISQPEALEKFHNMKMKESSYINNLNLENLKKSELLQKVYSFRKNACQCLMVVGWETNMEMCKKLWERTTKLIETFKKLEEKEGEKASLEIMIKTLNGRLKGMLDNFEEIKI